MQDTWKAEGGYLDAMLTNCWSAEHSLAGDEGGELMARKEHQVHALEQRDYEALQSEQSEMKMITRRM